MSLKRFAEYAREFEKTYDDDDWSRLERHFAPDAVYEVRGAPFTCRLETPAAILGGIKKSLDGFDRKFPKRTLALTGPPTSAEDRVSVGWTARYELPDVPAFVLRGRSTARYRDGQIVELLDEYEDDTAGVLDAWTREHGVAIDPSYV